MKSILILVIIISSAAHGVSFVSDFLSADCDFVTSGFGGSNFTEGSAASVFGNPASVNRRGPQFYASHESLFENLLISDALGVTVRTRAGDFAIGGLYLGGGGIEVTRLPNPDAPVGPGNRPYSVSTEGHHDFAIGSAYAFTIRENFSLGASAGGIFRSLINERAFGGFLSVGAEWSPIMNLQLGLIAANSSFLAWSTGTNEFGAPELIAGGHYGNSLGAGFAYRITGELNFLTSARDFEYTTGAELSYRSVVAFRAGFDDGAVSAGADFSIFPGVSVGAALATHRELPVSYRFGLNIYEKPRDE